MTERLLKKGVECEGDEVHQENSQSGIYVPYNEGRKAITEVIQIREDEGYTEIAHLLESMREAGKGVKTLRQQLAKIVRHRTQELSAVVKQIPLTE